MEHLAIGPGNGFLIALMSEKGPVGKKYRDEPMYNDETTEEVNKLDSIPICVHERRLTCSES